MRGAVFCKSCKKRLTASYSTGKYKKKYAYYWCNAKGCSKRYKTIKKGTIDPNYEKLLKRTRLPKPYVALVEKVMTDTWQKEKSSYVDQTRALKGEKNRVEEAISRLTQRVVKTNNESLIQTYEEEIKKLAQESDNLDTKLPADLYSDETFGTSLGIVMDTLENPLETWKNRDMSIKKTVLFMYFDNYLEYDIETGFGTPKYSRGINILQSFTSKKSSMAEMGGIEPPS